jgi:hypothetical protein
VSCFAPLRCDTEHYVQRGLVAFVGESISWRRFISRYKRPAILTDGPQPTDRVSTMRFARCVQLCRRDRLAEYGLRRSTAAAARRATSSYSARVDDLAIEAGDLDANGPAQTSMVARSRGKTVRSTV